MAIEAMKQKDGTFRFRGRSFRITEDKNQALEPFGMRLHNYGVVLMLLPDAAQVNSLDQQIGNARFIRNRYLADRQAYYGQTGEVLTVSSYKKEYLPKLKEEFPFLRLSDKFALEASLEHVENAYKKFFRERTGFPRFASKYQPSGSCYTTKFTNGNLAVLTGVDDLPYVKLPKIGNVRFVLPKGRTVQDLVPAGVSILSASIKRSGPRYTVSLQLETVIEKPPALSEVSIRDIAAADMGLARFAAVGTIDSVNHIENPRWIKLHEKRLRRLQKSLSRKQYDRESHTGSRNWEKARRKVAAEQRKCANQRRDFQHKLSRRIADACAVFVCEDLNIRGMVKNRRLSKGIASVGWGNFLNYVNYKLERKGGIFLKADRYYASSRLCSVCGHKHQELKLSDRMWNCPECGAHHDRDENAVFNLLAEGRRMLAERGIAVTI